MTNETETTDLDIIETPESMIASEKELRSALVPIVRESLAIEGATARISGRTHYTRQGLLTIAGHLNVSCDFDMPRDTLDPETGEHGHEVRCTARRMDGVSQQAIGFASIGEMVALKRTGELVRRWDDFFAVRSMAQTRAQVRALNALLLPAIQQASAADPDRRISTTPAEDMPPDRGEARKQAAATAAQPAARAPQVGAQEQPAAFIAWARTKWTLEGGASGVQQILEALGVATWGEALGPVDGDWHKLAVKLGEAWKPANGDSA